MKNLLKKITTFAILTVSGYVYADLPYVPIQFPRDDYAHYENVPYPVSHMTEWWYFNGQLTTTDGHTFGYYVSYNYFMMQQKTGKPILIPMKYLQITDVDNKKVYGNALLGDANQSMFSSTSMAVNIGSDDRVTKVGESFLVDANMTAKTGEKLQMNLKLTPARQAMLIGGNGYVPEDNHTISYYYSFPNVITEGSFVINGKTYTIDPKKSLSWYDRQWGDFSVAPQSMWVWSSIQLDNGMAINLRWVINAKTKQPNPEFCDATILMPDNSQLFTKNIKVENYLPHGNEYPTDYQITIPELGMHLTLHDGVGHQNAGGIYEGIVSVHGYDNNSQSLSGTAWAESSVKNN